MDAMPYKAIIKNPKMGGGGKQGGDNFKAGGEGDNIVKCVGSNFPGTGNENRKNEGRGPAISDPEGQGLEGYRDNAGEPAFVESGYCNQIEGIKKWWSIEPGVGRLADGVSARVDRLKCLGNSIVPEIGQMIWLIIKPYFEDKKKIDA
jgi:hypothetical protein